MIKMKSILNILLLSLLLLLCTTTINAIPTLKKRQGEGVSTSSNPDINYDILTPLTPLPVTDTPERYYNLVLSRANLAPDGFTRLVWTSNDQYPGPTIRANKGDRLIINVTNNLDRYTSIHWHGIFQRGTTYFDGVTGQVSYCDGPNILYTI